MSKETKQPGIDAVAMFYFDLQDPYHIEGIFDFVSPDGAPANLNWSFAFKEGRWQGSIAFKQKEPMT